MHTKFLAILMIFLVLLLSVLISIAPTFFTKGVSRVSLHQAIELPLILNTDKKIELIFFGYSGCTDICTPRLHTIAIWYDSFKYKDKVQVKFLDISQPYDSFLPNLFARSFHKDFRGVYLTETNLRQYTKAFNVYFSKSLVNKYEFDHTANLYLLKRSKNLKELRYIYTAYPYDLKQINTDIEELLYD